MVILKSADEIERMRQAGRIVAEVLDYLKKLVQPGITTLELDREAERQILRRGGKPTFKGYKRFINDDPFPGCICTSINEEVIHGIPSGRKLQKGDIISIDIGVRFEGFCSDAAITLPVESISQEAKDLLEATEESLYQGIEKACVGNRLQDISYAIQRYVEERGFSVVRDFVGHGIGRSPHEDPQVPNFGKPGRGIRLEEGMVLAIEPMVIMGSYEVEVLANGWTAVAVDNSLSAHFEHTVAITGSGPEILSKI
ncbi:MAG: type I methionyl aminopeptidase [bacterium]|nr:type I methionyl aminopeptidase [bacterium]